MSTDGATPILVQCPECQPHHLLVIVLVHLVGHHVAELWELYLPRSICIILTTQILVQLITAFSWSCLWIVLNLHTFTDTNIRLIPILIQGLQFKLIPITEAHNVLILRKNHKTQIL